MPAAHVLLLVLAWCGLSLLSLASAPGEAGYAIHAFALLGVVESILIWREAERSHCYSFSPLHIFVLAGAGYFFLMPWLSVVIDYHYVISESERHGVRQLIQIYFWIILLFALSYRAAIGSSQITPWRAGDLLRPGVHKRVLVVSSAIAIFVGFVAYAWLYAKLGAAFGEGYVQLAEALRGSVWILRLADFLALGALVYLCAGQMFESKSLAAIGVAAIVTYALLRAPFANRENVARFIVIGVLFLILAGNKQFASRRLVLGFVTIGVLAALLPVLSYLRGGQELGALTDLYVFFLFRDLNFIEPFSAVLAQGGHAGEIGIIEGLRSFLGSFVPRDVWPGKPFPLAVQITAWVTPVTDYDADDPSFAYATGFLGAAYVSQGLILVATTAALLGYSSGRVLKWARESTYREPGHIRLLIAATFSYFAAFSVQKLDPSNVVPGAIFPFSYFLALHIYLGWHQPSTKPD